MNEQTVRLNTGLEMPLLGLGTWKMSDAVASASVRLALEAGYRSFDTAKMYGNETGVGAAVRESGIPRGEIFVTTKLWPSDFFEPQKAFEQSLRRLGLEYADLYLVHWPIPMMPKKVWREMEAIFRTGRARAIGVSNYATADIETLLEYAAIVPSINQVKCSPFDYDPALHAYCTERGIVLEAYSPLARGTRLRDETVGRIARAYGKTPAQILIRWCVEHKMPAIPKSSDPDRIRENAAVFDFSLAPKDMADLDALAIRSRSRR